MVLTLVSVQAFRDTWAIFYKQIELTLPCRWANFVHAQCISFAHLSHREHTYCHPSSSPLSLALPRIEEDSSEALPRLKSAKKAGMSSTSQIKTHNMQLIRVQFKKTSVRIAPVLPFCIQSLQSKSLGRDCLCFANVFKPFLPFSIYIPLVLRAIMKPNYAQSKYMQVESTPKINFKSLRGRVLWSSPAFRQMSVNFARDSGSQPSVQAADLLRSFLWTFAGAHFQRPALSQIKLKASQITAVSWCVPTPF